MKPAYAILENKKVIPVEFYSYAEWVGEAFGEEKRRVCLNNLPGDIMVSTVFLGINHGWHDEDLWFETMIFGGPHDDYMVRYATWDEAIAGHEKALQMAKEKQ